MQGRCKKENRRLEYRRRNFFRLRGFSSDPRIDQAIAIRPVLEQFLQQRMKEVVPYDQCLEGLRNVAMTLVNGQRR
ncbi:MAG: hypothetical protein PHD18_04830 [Tolumonas sp.]|nr:hypothetical protein [Tolumonas sp.]